RLERRTLLGSMYFIAQGPQGIDGLRTALVGRDQNGYYACEIGTLERDNRGQLTLGYTFDPRNICDHELEDYQLIAVCLVEGNNLSIVLFGNVNGFADINWERVRTTLYGLFFPDRGSVGDILPPPLVGIPPRPMPQPPQVEIPPRPAPRPPVQQPDIPPRPTPRPPAQNPQPEIPSQDIPTTLPDYSMELPAYPAETQGENQNRPSAADEMGMDPDMPWPEAVETLKPLFFSSPAIEAAPDDRFKYIAAPMPDGSGYKSCYAGIRAENGMPVEVSYAIPSAYQPNPPAGMDEYRWIGDQNAGWWAIEQQL
ncbi:MAG: hypothetical protein IJA26_01855, partial [Clostridia bacterium]|nr:hypothetical protein [Clostridia bacterium]